MLIKSLLEIAEIEKKKGAVNIKRANSIKVVLVVIETGEEITVYRVERRS